MRARLYLNGTLVQGLFSLAAIARHARATHQFGVGAAGTFTVTTVPEFPEHEFFTPGRVFPLQLRHANLEIEDDAGLDVRGAALKLADSDAGGPLDIIMNTGIGSAFTNVPMFLAFVRDHGKSREGTLDYQRRFPGPFSAGLDALRRSPSSFTRLQYYSQVVFRFTARDGMPRYVRYRLLPVDGRAEDGLASATDRESPWIKTRLPDETRPPDYLRREFKALLSSGPVIYTLQAQLHFASQHDPPSIFDSSLPWEDIAHPWLDLGIVRLDRALPDDETERLRFDLRNHPQSLGIIEATSHEDFNSLVYLRTRTYRLAQAARLLRIPGRRRGPIHDD